MGSQRVRHDWMIFTFTYVEIETRVQWTFSPSSATCFLLPRQSWPLLSTPSIYLMPGIEHTSYNLSGLYMVGCSVVLISLVVICQGSALAGSRGHPQDEQRRREKTRETSLDRAKSVFYFLTTVFIPSLRMYPSYKMLTHAYTELVLHQFVFRKSRMFFAL